MSLTRRDFLKVASTRGTLLVVAISWEQGPLGEGTQGATAFTPNQWLTIDETGAVTLILHKSEMGQGVATALPMILADELGADWRQVRVEHAVPGPLFPNMGTSGSGSVSGSWLPLRRAAAAARAMSRCAGSGTRPPTSVNSARSRRGGFSGTGSCAARAT
ncbi:MAG TPA: molybdopterin cofactor-binding domain-containing protein, partial [Gemmatimonadaceae bacterium]